MKELILVMASAMDRDAIVDELKKVIAEYEKDKDDASFGKLTVMCMVASAKQSTEKRSLEDLFRDMDRIDKGNELLKTRTH